MEYKPEYRSPHSAERTAAAATGLSSRSRSPEHQPRLTRRSTAQGRPVGRTSAGPPPAAQGSSSARCTRRSLDSFYTPNDEFFTVKHYEHGRLAGGPGASAATDWSRARSGCRSPPSRPSPIER